MTARIEEITQELDAATERLALTVAEDERGEVIASIQRLQVALVAALRRTNRREMRQ